ncbi:hypothetical protein LTR84_008943 [Exophiala bonariae]|uniref:NmrA-like domain-containing protein n=1 Tax=Exophiala bonariae TaxID=1690606 RepID=A0AAV9MYN0_9EURO|nr:hypothetical protein LTR84_008943 [Exophiala bonariae]
MSTYLISAATGQQGGPLVDSLLAAGVKVHAVVRDLSSPKAKTLKDKGVLIWEGTHEEPDAFRAAATGVSGFFLNLSAFEPGVAKKQAEGVIAAVKAGAGETLKSIVLSSTSRTADLSKDLATPSSIHPWLGGYYTAKAEVEAAVRESQIRHYTILRPPVLNYDLLLPHSAQAHGYPRLPTEGVLVTSLDEGLTMPYLDEVDVGKYAAAALLEPEKFSGHEFEIAGDNLSAQEVRDVLARVSGIDIKFHRRTPKEVEAAQNTEFFQVFEKLTNLRPHEVDVKALEEKYGIKVASLEDYMQRHKEKLLNSLPPRAAAAL